MKRTKGIIFAALSAILFGFSPTVTSVIFANGGNSLTVAFLRSLLSLPILLALILIRRLSLKVNRQQLIEIILIAVIGVAATGLTLITSYTYISGGLATTLHFIYPALTAVCGWLFFKERLGGLAIGALVIIMVGVVLFSANTVTVQPLGVVLALISGFTYTFYIVFLANSHLQKHHIFVLSFYFMFFSAAAFALFGLVTGGLDFASLTPTAWGFSFINALVASIGGSSLFQLGVRYAGPTTTSMMSALEPATSVVCGFLIAGDVLTTTEIIGCVAVLVGIILLLPAKNKAQAATPEGTVVEMEENATVSESPAASTTEPTATGATSDEAETQRESKE